MDGKVVLTTFTYPSELIAARGRLEYEGINCFVKDELTVQIYNFYSTAIGGITLEVMQSDFEKGRKILIETGFLMPENASSKTENEVVLIGKDSPLQCPECESKNISKPEISKLTFAISFLLLGIPLFFMGKTQFCFDCGTKFKRVDKSYV
jgi:hypothetical protein